MSEQRLLALRARGGLMSYVLLLAGALAASLRRYGLDIWQLMPRLLALALFAAVLFTLRQRIAPSRDPYGRPLEQLCGRVRRGWQFVRELSTEE